MSAGAARAIRVEKEGDDPGSGIFVSGWAEFIGCGIELGNGSEFVPRGVIQIVAPECDIEVAEALSSGTVAQKEKLVAVRSDEGAVVIGSAVDFGAEVLGRSPGVSDAGAPCDINILTTKTAGSIGNVVKTETSLCDEWSDLVRSRIDQRSGVDRRCPFRESLAREAGESRRNCNP